MSKSNQDKKMNIAIIGYGRFGRLLAKMLYPYGKIHIVEKKEIKITKGKKIGLPELKDMDWVIPAVPISELKDGLKEMSPFLKKGSLVMDVCSVKTYPCQWLKRYIPSGIEVLGTHPMFGPDSAKNGLAGLQIVLCPIRISKTTLRKIKRAFRELQLKTIVTTPRTHDQQAAKSLALVHYLGRALAKIKISQQLISTLGFARLLTVNETVENDTWQLFYDMHNFNPYAKRARKDFVKALQGLELDINKRHKNT